MDPARIRSRLAQWIVPWQLDARPRRRTEFVSHDALLDNVARVRRDPEDLGGKAASPEVNDRLGERGAAAELLGEQIVRRPPGEEEAAEQHRRREPMVQARDAVR